MPLVRIALKAGFRCGTLLFRCAEDIPITAAKFNVIVSYDDAKELSDFVYNKYVLCQKTKQKKC